MLLLGLTGCLPESQNPLSSQETATADARLAGVWYGRSGDDKIFLHFVAGKGPVMSIVEVDHDAKGEAHTTLYRMFPSVIDGTRYMNVREGKEEGKPYYLARYRLSDSGILKIWLMSETAATKAIKSHKLKGVVTPGANNSVDVKITDTTEHLSSFVGNSDPGQLFDQEFGTFKKVTLPSLESPAKPADGAKAKTGTSTRKSTKKK